MYDISFISNLSYHNQPTNTKKSKANIVTNLEVLSTNLVGLEIKPNPEWCFSVFQSF